MAKEIINNAETGLVVRNKINNNFTDFYNVIGAFGTGNQLLATAGSPINITNLELKKTGVLNGRNSYFNGENVTNDYELKYTGTRWQLNRIDNDLGTTFTINANVGSEAFPFQATWPSGTSVFLGSEIINTNTFIGVQTGTDPSNTGGVGWANLKNTAVGYRALRNINQDPIMTGNPDSNLNTAIGADALFANVSGYRNTAVGANALLSNTASSNTAIGAAALTSNTIGSSNTASGADALLGNINGARNTAVGSNTLPSNTSGNNNTAVGANTLASNTTGSSNTSLGYGSLYNSINAVANTAVGALALLNNTGNNNTAVGFNALLNNTTFTNVGGFGYDAQVTASNQIRIGNSFITSVTCQTNAWSDGRDKADIRDTVLGLNFINELRPVDYKWDYREDYRTSPPNSVIKPLELKEDASDEEKEKYAVELAAYEAYVVIKDKWLEDSKLKNITHDGTHKRTRFHHGLIAQEIKSVIEKTGVDFGGFQDHSIDGGDEAMTIGYNELIGPMIKAIQELSQKLDNALTRIEVLENK